MSRFENLELGGDAEENLGSGAVLKDQAYYMFEARQAYECGDFEKGLRYYSKVLEFDPQQVGAWSGQVRMLIELGEFREAKLWADKALERFPRDPELLAGKGVALGRLGDVDEALAYSDASIEERGDTPYVWLARADVLLARREPKAQYCLDKALVIALGDWFVIWLASRIRMFYSQFSLALKLLQQAISINSGHYLLWLDLGRCQVEMGMKVPAENSFRQARQLNPCCIESSAVATHLSTGRFRSLFRRIFSR